MLWPGEKASLAALGERFKIINEEAHRALCDVEATAKILEHADRGLREAAEKKGAELRGDGCYIRDVIETAARKRRIAAIGEEAVLVEEKQAVTIGRSGNGQAASLLPQFYITPSGFLWHCNRACERLDVANVIQRVLRRPYGKPACNMCVKLEEGIERLEKKERNKGRTIEVNERIDKKNSPRRTSLRLRQQHR